MSIKYDSTNLKMLFKLDDDLKLVLPNYQRDFVWTTAQQQDLLCSLLANVPIGSILILHGTAEDYASRPLGLNCTATPSEECQYLLDGQQRLSAFKSIFGDFFLEATWKKLSKDAYDPSRFKEIYDKIYSRLRRRWFLSLVASDGADEDPFGLKDLKFPAVRSFEPGDFQGFVESEFVHKGKSKEWYHPNYTGEVAGRPLTGHRLKLEIAKKAAQKKRIPLWEIIDRPKDGLHVDALKLIARSRLDELRAQVKDGALDLCTALEGVNPHIADIVASGDETSISEAWTELQSYWVTEVTSFLTRLVELPIPTIELPVSESRRGVAIFETINRGGTTLSAFDLVVARMARKDEKISLSANVYDAVKQPFGLPDAVFGDNRSQKPATWTASCMKITENGGLSQNFKNFFLNYLGITCFRKIKGSLSELKPDQIKRAWILQLSKDEIFDNHQRVALVLQRALCFLQFRCGVVSDSDLKYKLMILPIASALEDDGVWQDKKQLDRVEYWYWASLFGGAYQSRQNENCIRDVVNLPKWLQDASSNPFETREQGTFAVKGYSDKATLLKENGDELIVSNVEDAILQYVLSEEPKDFLKSDTRLTAWDVAGGTYQIEDHHIIPLHEAATVGESTKKLRSKKTHILNSAANRTFILAESNKEIGSHSLKKYMDRVTASAAFGHILPTPLPEKLARQPEETDEKYYKRLLGERFGAICQQVKKELDKLSGR